MKRWSLLSIPVVVAAIFLTTVSVIEAKRIPDWQEALNHYIRADEATTSPVRQVVWVVKARLPWEFEADSPFNVIDHGRFAGSGYTYDSKAYGPRTEHVALPYPPQEVYCVLLQEDATERVIFINYYTDHLWQYGWVIQDGAYAPFTSEFLQVLDEVGCTL